MLPLFLFGLFISSIVMTACGLIIWGIREDHRERNR